MDAATTRAGALRWRRIRDLFVWPLLVSCLPWRLGFGLLRWRSKQPGLAEDALNVAWSHASEQGFGGPSAAVWKKNRRLVGLVDHADMFLALTRGRGWMGRYLSTQGHWPPPQVPGLLITFHWGAGMWGLKHARAAGLQPHMLLADVHPGLGAIEAFYIRSRRWVVEHVLGCAVLRVPVKGGGGAVEDDQARSFDFDAIRMALSDGRQVLVVIDVPPDQAHDTVQVSLLGRHTRLPARLLRFAAEQSIPITAYWTGVDLNNGRRWLELRPLGVPASADDAANRLSAMLNEIIRHEPVAWHLWSEVDRFFRPEWNQ